MSQRIRATKTRRRSLTLLWIVGLAIVVSVLIYFERTEMLYILATLGVTALLVIVATADLGRRPSPTAELVDAQAAGSGISSRPPTTSKK